MGVIHILDEVVANQIAAGEVVERPASIVKELLENSLDAGATQIDVLVEQGGIGRLRVTDNGTGMLPDDAVMCLSRYATSKLRSPDDLANLTSFGFRGEALPSIASVSRFTITTRHVSQSVATKVRCEGGKIAEVTEAGAPVGTCIEIEDLFFNVPARRKFLKSERSESAAIDGVVRVAALSAAHVGFKLTVDGKSTIDVRQAPPEAPLEHPRMMERVIQSLGDEVRGVIYPIFAKTDLLSLTGYVVAPVVTRRDYAGIFLYVNHRPVQDRQLMQAVKVAFRTLLEVGRNPLCALNLTIDSSIVDVNVHPQKREVRFSDASRVQGHLISLLSEFLATTPWLTTSKEPSLLPSSPTPSSFSLGPSTRDTVGYREPVAPFMMRQAPSQPQLPSPVVVSPGFGDALRYCDLRVVGQIANTFIMLEGARSLIVIDQHAAHERVMFERIVASLKSGSIARQALLLPLQLRLDAREMVALVEHQEILLRFGFELEPFGENHAVLKAAPTTLSQEAAVTIVKDALSDLVQHGRADALQEVQDHLCAQLACHGSIRSGQSLSRDEITALLQELDVIDFGAHCPHGRPVVRNIAVEEMASWFNRHSI